MEKLNFNIEIYSNFLDYKGDVLIPQLFHGSNIIEIVNGNEDLSNCDAIFTKNKNFKLGIKTADCAAVCYSDGKTIGIAHIGWLGLCTNLNVEILKKFNESKIEIFISPFIHRFEVKKDFCYDKLKVNFENFFEYEDSKIYFNFKKALLSIMPEGLVVLDERNTLEDLSLPSHRRDKTKDRLLTIISFK